MNDYEDDARDRKAERLAAILYDRGRDLCFQQDTREGRKPRSADQCAGDIMTLATHMEPRHWLAITDAHNRELRERRATEGYIRPPSRQTMALAADKVIERARRAQQRARQETSA